MKNIKMAMTLGVIVLAFSACGQVKGEEYATNQQGSNVQTVEHTDSETEGNETINAKESSANQQESDIQTRENADSEIEGNGTIDAKESSASQQESGVQTVGNADSEMTAEELLDSFISGSISAVDSMDLTKTFSITDLNMDSGEGDAYSIGEKVDLDNDGENELIINGPYGGIYLDARDNTVYEFATTDGTAVILSYTYYNGAIWIMYSNRSSAGFEFYHMEQYEGADNLVAEMNFGEEFDPDHPEAGVKYTLNGEVISYDEYTELCSKILAAEVYTN